LTRKSPCEVFGAHTQKNDERDAEAIAEAATRPTMRYVEVKSEAQLEVQSLHRVRERLVAERTALINQLRSLMLERGITVPQGRCKLERHLPSENCAPKRRARGIQSPMLLRPKRLDLRLERGFDRPVRRLNSDHARPGIGDTASLADAFDLCTLLREFASAQD
jgi:transposase